MGGTVDSTFPTPDTSPVAVGVDGSDAAREAALWAGAEAVRRERPLHVVHAADTEGRALYLPALTVEQVCAAGRRLLDETAKDLADEYPGLRVTTELSRAERRHRPARGRGPARHDRGVGWLVVCCFRHLHCLSRRWAAPPGPGRTVVRPGPGVRFR
ncbi:hypothetical protein UK14_25850 [Streptomyces sp. NRRL F-4428]|nr:hypothetical protein UK14_25850 [Streptomyces sp. NRRL F-4428]